MVHLSALPGSVRYEQSLDVTIERAIREAGRWVAAGADAIMVENFFDAPFALESVPPITVACLTRCAAALRAGIAFQVLFPSSADSLERKKAGRMASARCGQRAKPGFGEREVM